MSTLGAIRTAIKTTIEANVTGIICYDKASDVVQVPAVVVVPMSGDFGMGMAGGNCVNWEFALYVLTPRTETGIGQSILDEYIDGGGSKSVSKTIKDNPQLGLSDVSAQLSKMSDYGGEYKSSGEVMYVGAKLHLKVLVTQ
jgi:hypothetical protein